jgi:membrane protein
LDDKIGHYASSLSWSTLFSIIPLLVIVLWIFTTMPLFDSVYQNIESFIFTSLLPADSKEIMAYINTFMDNSHKLGYVGLFYVLFAAVLFLKNYDFIVNDIFNTPSRSLLEAIKTYMLLTIIVPVLLGLSFYLSSYMQSYLDKDSLITTIYLYYFLPFLMVWMVFYILYQNSANTLITRSSALISSFITSLVWYLSKSAFLFYILHNKTYTSIYGSISTILFFFLWIYISWAIFLHGLKFCNLLNRNEEIDHI